MGVPNEAGRQTDGRTDGRDQPMTRERRRARRIAGPFDGTYTGAAGRRDVRIVDLSEDGCFLDAAIPTHPGERFSVQVCIDGEKVTLSGEVVYVDRVQGVAVRFVNHSAEAQIRLKNIISLLTS
jgi:hypothetical protein